MEAGPRRKRSCLIPAVFLVGLLAVGGWLAWSALGRNSHPSAVSLTEVRLFNCDFDPEAPGVVVVPGGMVSTITIRENPKYNRRRLTLSIQEGSARPFKVTFQQGLLPTPTKAGQNGDAAENGGKVLFDQTIKPEAQKIEVGKDGGRISITHQAERGPLRLVLSPG